MRPPGCASPSAFRDLLDEYRVTSEIGFALNDEEEQDPLPAEALWDGYRQRVEATESPKR